MSDDSDGGEVGTAPSILRHGLAASCGHLQNGLRGVASDNKSDLLHKSLIVGLSRGATGLTCFFA
jgi:hypothetical protein